VVPVDGGGVEVFCLADAMGFKLLGELVEFWSVGLGDDGGEVLELGAEVLERVFFGERREVGEAVERRWGEGGVGFGDECPVGVVGGAFVEKVVFGVSGSEEAVGFFEVREGARFVERDRKTWIFFLIGSHVRGEGFCEVFGFVLGGFDGVEGLEGEAALLVSIADGVG